MFFLRLCIAAIVLRDNVYSSRDGIKSYWRVISTDEDIRPDQIYLIQEFTSCVEPIKKHFVIQMLGLKKKRKNGPRTDNRWVSMWKSSTISLYIA